MKQVFFTLMTTLLFALQLNAQSEETVFGHRGLDISGAWGGTHTHITQFDDDYAIFGGGHVGLEFGQKLMVGWRWTRLLNDVRTSNAIPQDLDMKYSGLTIGYMLNAHKPFHPIFSVSGGRGKVKLDEAGIEDRIYVVQPAVGLEINLFRWFHLGFEGGYRAVIDTDIANLTDNDLSGVFGEVKFKFGWSWGW